MQAYLMHQVGMVKTAEKTETGRLHLVSAVSASSFVDYFREKPTLQFGVN